jgi:hypothetical protein
MLVALTPPSIEVMRRRWAVIIALVVLLPALGVGGWFTWRLASMPRGPDRATASDTELRAFIIRDDFNELYQWQRRAYLRAYMDRLEDLTLQQLILRAASASGEQEAFIRNVLKVEGRDEILSPFVGVFLDKFYGEPPERRMMYLSLFARLNQGQVLQNPERFGLPPPDRFQRDMHRFMSQQPVRAQAQMGQFLIELQATRRAMGYPDPF